MFFDKRLYKYFSEKNTLEWIEILEKIAFAINNTVHTMTGIRPIDMTYENANDFRKDLVNQRDSTHVQLHLSFFN
jgi:hypothetical protein